MADAQIVYGSTGEPLRRDAEVGQPDARRRPAARPSQTTVIDRFDVSDPDTTTFVASGEVPGYLLNQFSLSEYNGYLRVATHEPADLVGRPDAPQTHEPELRDRPRDEGRTCSSPVGQVSGLGQGEQIYSVRFVDDIGLRRHLPAGRPALHDRPEHADARRRSPASSS